MTYLEELQQLLSTAITRMKIEHADFVIFTVNIWTDKQANISVISFDDQQNSLQKLKAIQEFNQKQYEDWLAQGDWEMAQEFNPINHSPPQRATNPADFKLANFAEIKHQQPITRWYPTLQKFAKIAFKTIARELKIDPDHFELGINSSHDWYDKSWHIKDFKQEK